MKEAEVDAEVTQHAPRHECRRRKDELVVGCEDRSQKDCKKACQTKHHAVEKLAFSNLELVVERLPEIDARKTLRGQLGHIGYGLAGLQRDPKHVGAIALQPLGHETDRRRYGLDTARVEIGPDRAGSDDVIAVGRKPPLNRLVARVGQRENNPVRIGSRSRSTHRHAAADAIGAGRRFHLERVASTFVEFAERGDLDALLLG